MRENCTSGSARGASGNRRPYRGGFFPGMATPHLFGMRLNDISFRSLEVSCVRTQHPVEV